MENKKFAPCVKLKNILTIFTENIQNAKIVISKEV